MFWMSPLMAFPIVVGLGLDYDIFLMESVLEYYDAGDVGGLQDCVFPFGTLTQCPSCVCAVFSTQQEPAMPSGRGRIAAAAANSGDWRQGSTGGSQLCRWQMASRTWRGGRLRGGEMLVGVGAAVR